MKRFLQLFLFGIFWLLIFSQTAMGQESGWAGDGLIKFQKFPTDTIVKYGLSADGDTLKTFHKNGMLYYWDIISGKLLKEKQLPEGIKVSEDMLTYFIYTDSSNNSRGPFFVKVSVFDIYSDKNILSTKYFLISADSYTSYYDIFTDYSYNFKKFFIVLSCRYYTVISSNNYLSTHIITKKDFIENNTIKFGNPTVYNKDFNKVVFLSHSSYGGRHSEGSSGEDLAVSELNSIKRQLINDSRISKRDYRYPRFLNDDNKVSAFNSRKLHIWKLNPVELIEEHNPIKGYDSYSDYLYMRDDNYLAYSNDKIFIYDMNSKRIIDSSEAVSTTKSTVLLYSGTKDKFCFFNYDKFGIADFKMLNTNFDLQISVDSTHVYVGNPYNVYLYGLPNDGTVKWETSDGQTSSERNPIITFNEVGSKSFTVTVTHNNQTYKKTFEYVVNVLTTLSADFDSDVRFGSAPMVVKFRNLSTGSNLTYEWNFGNGKTSTEKDPNITYDSAGRYHVSLKVKDSLNAKINIKLFYIQIDSDIYEPLEIENELLTHSNKTKIPDREYPNDYAQNLIFSMGTVLIPEGSFSIYSEFGYGNQYYIYTAYLDTNIILTKVDQSNLGSIFYSPKFMEMLNKILIPIHTPKLGFLILSKNGQQEHINYTYGPYFGSRVNMNVISESSFVVSVNKNDTTNYVTIVDENGYNKKQDTLKLFSKDIVKVKTNEIYNIIFKKSENKHYIYVTDTNLIFIRQIEINNPEIYSFNTFGLLKNGMLAFGGNTKDSLGVIGVMNLDGVIEWTKINKNWKTFQRIKVLKNSFQLLGQNIESNPGFLEIDNKGEQFKDYRINRESSTYTCDVDILDSNFLLLTYTHGKYLHCVSKVKYSPLFIEDTPADTTDEGPEDPQDSIEIVRSEIVYPNPAKGEVKFSFKEEVTAREIQLFNTDGIMVERKLLSSAKISEYSINIDKLAIGIYFVKIYTDSGIIETKFIKGG